MTSLLLHKKFTYVLSLILGGYIYRYTPVAMPLASNAVVANII